MMNVDHVQFLPESPYVEIAKEIMEICDENIEIEGRGDDRYAYVTPDAKLPLIKYLKKLKVAVPCPICKTLMINQEDGDLVCPHCGVNY